MIRIRPEAVASLISGFYESAYDPERWPASIEAMRRVFGGSTACFVRAGPNIQPPDAVSANSDPRFLDILARDFTHEANLVRGALSAVPVGTIYKMDQIVGGRASMSRGFWNDWMAPQDMHEGLGCKLLESGPSNWFADIHRGRNQEDFSADDIELFSFLTPHLCRAAQLGRELQITQAIASTFSNLPFGAILVNGYQRILQTNAVAEAILSRRGNALHGKFGQLGTTDARSNAQLQNYIVNACSPGLSGAPNPGGDFMLDERHGTRAPTRLAISVSPFARSTVDGITLEPCAMVVIRELVFDSPAGLPRQLQQLFNLTAKEAQLAAFLAAGRTLKEAAEARSISFSTARSQLESVFSKTGMRQQSQLVALLKNLQPPRS